MTEGTSSAADRGVKRKAVGLMIRSTGSRYRSKTREQESGKRATGEEHGGKEIRKGKQKKRATAVCITGSEPASVMIMLKE